MFGVGPISGRTAGPRPADESGGSQTVADSRLVIKVHPRVAGDGFGDSPPLRRRAHLDRPAGGRRPRSGCLLSRLLPPTRPVPAQLPHLDHPPHRRVARASQLRQLPPRRLRVPRCMPPHRVAGTGAKHFDVGADPIRRPSWWQHFRQHIRPPTPPRCHRSGRFAPRSTPRSPHSDPIGPRQGQLSLRWIGVQPPIRVGHALRCPPGVGAPAAVRIPGRQVAEGGVGRRAPPRRGSQA